MIFWRQGKTIEADARSESAYNLRDRAWKISDSSDENNPVADFYIPALEWATQDDRKSGFFNSSILIVQEADELNRSQPVLQTSRARDGPAAPTDGFAVPVNPKQ